MVVPGEKHIMATSLLYLIQEPGTFMYNKVFNRRKVVVRIATDIRTFTDLVCIDENCRMVAEKSHARRTLNRVSGCNQKSGLSDYRYFVHGTTTIINILLNVGQNRS